MARSDPHVLRPTPPAILAALAWAAVGLVGLRCAPVFELEATRGELVVRASPVGAPRVEGARVAVDFALSVANEGPGVVAVLEATAVPDGASLDGLPLELGPVARGARGPLS